MEGNRNSSINMIVRDRITKVVGGGREGGRGG